MITMRRLRRYSAETEPVHFDIWETAGEKENRTIDYDTWKAIVIISFSRKSGLTKSVAGAWLNGKGLLKKFWDDKLSNGSRKNPEAVAKIIWCQFKGKSKVC